MEKKTKYNIKKNVKGFMSFNKVRNLCIEIPNDQELGYIVRKIFGL